MEARFTSPLPPSVNDYLGKKVAYSFGKPYVLVYETIKAKAYKKRMQKILQREVINNGWNKTNELQYVICDITVYLSQKKRDSDNMFKCLLDSFKEADIIYDDCMIIPRVRDVFIESSNPRIEVELKLADKIGIFENSSEFEKFKENNCYNCKKYRTYGERCSQLKASIENRITGDIDVKNLECKLKK